MVKVWPFKSRSKHSLDNTQGCTIKESTFVTPTTKKCATPVLLLPHQRENSTENEFNRNRSHSQQRLEPPPTLAQVIQHGQQDRYQTSQHITWPFLQPAKVTITFKVTHGEIRYIFDDDATRIISQLFIQLSPYTVMASYAHNAIQSFQ